MNDFFSTLLGILITCGGFLAIIGILEIIPWENGKKAPKKKDVMPSELDDLWTASTIRTDVVFEKVAADRRANQAKLDLIQAAVNSLEKEVSLLARTIK